MHVKNLVPSIDLSKVDFLETMKQEEQLKKFSSQPAFPRINQYKHGYLTKEQLSSQVDSSSMKK